MLQVQPVWGEEYLAVEAAPRMKEEGEAGIRLPFEEQLTDLLKTFAETFQGTRESWQQRLGQLKASGRRVVAWRVP